MSCQICTAEPLHDQLLTQPPPPSRHCALARLYSSPLRQAALAVPLATMIVISSGATSAMAARSSVRFPDFSLSILGTSPIPRSDAEKSAPRGCNDAAVSL